MSKEPKKQSRAYLIILIILLISSVGGIAYFSWKSHLGFRETIAGQWYQQLLTTTSIVSVNLQSFIEKYSENLISIAEDPHIKEMTFMEDTVRSEDEYCSLGSLYEIHKSDVDAILLLNEHGVRVRQYPQDHEVACIKDEHCLQGVKDGSLLKPGETYVGDVFMNKFHEPAITVSCPVYYKGEFVGIVRWMVSIKTIAEKFLDSIKVGVNGYIWMIDGDYTVLAHHHEDLLEKNVFKDKIHITETGDSEKLTDTSELNWNFFRKIEKLNEGTGICMDLAHGEKSLAAFKKVKFGNNNWILITNIPYEELTGPIFRNAVKNYAMGTTVSIIIVLVSISFYRTQKRKTQLEVETKYLAQIAQSAKELEQERNKRLTALIDGQELERERVSRELHDGLGQHLLAIKMKLDNFESDKDHNANSVKKDIISLFDKTIEETKRISDNIVPVELDELGIVSAFKKLCEDIEKNNNFKIDFVSYGIKNSVSNKIKTYLYRIAQEALNNIIKHSDASEVNVQLLGNEEQITLIIQDNGKGFEINDLSRFKGNGLHNIKERALILNGNFNLSSEPGSGTGVKVKIPLN